MAHSLHCWGMAIGFVLCWSSGFVGGELAQQTDMPSLWLFAWRFLIAGGLAIGLGLLLSPRPSVKTWLWEALVGGFTVGGYLLGIMLALHYGVSAAVTALITSLQPLLVALMINRGQTKSESMAQWQGMLIATAGVALCILADAEQFSDPAPFWAYSLPIGAMLSLTLGSMMACRQSCNPPSHRNPPNHSQRNNKAAILPALGAQFLAAALLFAITAHWMMPPDHYPNGSIGMDSTSGLQWAALTWLILLSSFGGYGFYVACLRQLGIARTTQLIYFSPGVTLIWSALMFDHPLTLAGISGIVITLIGVFWSQRQRRWPKHLLSGSNHHIAHKT